MNHDELRQKIKWERSKGATFDVFLFDDVERLLDENEALRARIDRAVNLGHNDDCMFCGFKDKALGDAS